LQVVSATLSKVTIAMYQVSGKVLNTSDEVLTARITVGFLTDGGGLDQTQYTLVADIQPGQQKSFTVSSIDTFNNCTDFSIMIEVWD
jgi:D-Tyr-tRNAtyr deacylase